MTTLERPRGEIGASPPYTSCYHEPGDGVRFDLSLDDMRDVLASGRGLLWVDLHADGREEGEPLLRDVFGFHQLTVDDCYNTTVDPPKIDDYDAYLFIIIHNLAYDAERISLRTSELDLYVGRCYVVSVHRSPVHAVEDVRRRAERNPLLLERGPGFLAHALIDVVVDDFRPVVEAVDEQVSAVEEEVLDNPTRQTLERILQLKRVAQRLKRTILPQRDVMNRLSRNEYPELIPEAALMYFRDIYDHTVRVEETIESVRDLADSALSTYLSAVNNRLNEVMKTLAIVTVIFLPLTLIAGIYGTNFDNVPEYGLRFGYAGMLIAMGIVAGALALWFKWRRWF